MRAAERREVRRRVGCEKQNAHPHVTAWRPRLRVTLIVYKEEMDLVEGVHHVTFLT
jgi:hypothetical protein